jgi:hypothetical protein
MTTLSTGRSTGYLLAAQGEMRRGIVVELALALAPAWPAR